MRARTPLFTAAALLALAALAGPAAAADAPLLLRPDVTVDSDYVRLGDLVANAGPAGEAAVFRAPNLGATGTIQAARVLEAAAEHDLGPVETSGFSAVIVRRTGRLVGLEEIRSAVRQALAARKLITAETRLSFDASLRPFAVESTARDHAVATDVSVDRRSGRFEAHIRVPGSAIAERLDVRVGGSTGDTVMVPALAHAMHRGEVIQRSDITIERKRRDALSADTVFDTDRLVGMLISVEGAPGQILRESEIDKPELVSRGGLVLLVYENRGIVLTVKGKAMASGSAGDVVSVQNLTSKKVVEGLVTGPGRISVAAVPQPFTTASAANP